MATDRIIALMRDFNPWWEGKAIAVPDYKRHAYAKVEKYIKTKQIIAIVGLRRVGKTVLMRQMIREITSKHKENVFYFLFDELLAQHENVLEDVLDYYLKAISSEGKKYIFLDEIQKVPYWQEILKRYYDTREDIKFIISGSASLKIKKSTESLAGRIFDFYMPVLTFREFLELNGIEAKQCSFAGMGKAYHEIIHKKPLLEKKLAEYIFRGAFPELAMQEDEEIIRSYVKNSVIENILLKDIPAVFAVKRKDILAAILEYCARETSSLLDITNLAKILQANYATVKADLFYLKHSFLLDLAYNYSSSVAKLLRKNKKVHIAHPAISIAQMGYSKEILGTEDLVGKYIETIVYQHCRLLSGNVSFVRTPQKEEIDIIMEDPLVPVEVKYRNRVGISDADMVIKFAKQHRLKLGVVVTKDMFLEKEIDDIKLLFVPVWLFLLLV